MNEMNSNKFVDFLISLIKTVLKKKEVYTALSRQFFSRAVVTSYDAGNDLVTAYLESDIHLTTPSSVAVQYENFSGQTFSANDICIIHFMHGATNSGFVSFKTKSVQT